MKSASLPKWGRDVGSLAALVVVYSTAVAERHSKDRLLRLLLLLLLWVKCSLCTRHVDFQFNESSPTHPPKLVLRKGQRAMWPMGVDACLETGRKQNHPTRDCAMVPLPNDWCEIANFHDCHHHVAVVRFGCRRWYGLQAQPDMCGGDHVEQMASSARAANFSCFNHLVYPCTQSRRMVCCDLIANPF